MFAEIITIGDEILIGQIIDTNSAWMATELNLIGVKVVRISTIGDQVDDIKSALTEAFSRAEIVIITGGLGPTKDDITKHALADYFDDTLVMHENIAEHIEKLFARFGKKTSALNRQQAMLPSKCLPLQNMLGTAPGMWFDHKGKVAVSLPGVPYEMKGLMTKEVLPRFSELYQLPTIVHKTILTHGMGESWLSEHISDCEDALPAHIKLAYLPSPGRVRLRLSATGQDKERLISDVSKQVEKLHGLIPELIYGYDHEKLEEIIGRLLIKMKATVSTAESCTGGGISAAITSVAGASGYFMGSIVSYDNAVKVKSLGVSALDLESKGAVSEEVITQMAEGVRQTLCTDYSISTSGIAGPTGGTEEKPVGTVWIAVSGPSRSKAKRFQFGDVRERNIERTIMAALNMLRKELLKDLKALEN